MPHSQALIYSSKALLGAFWSGVLLSEIIFPTTLIQRHLGLVTQLLRQLIAELSSDFWSSLM